MSTEPYPDVNGDESGIVPPQGGRPAEWPKKIRTLTASELDRLTIDSSGRFYWDGRLVNYEPPQPKQSEPKPSDATDRSAMEIIERAVYELDAHKSPERIEDAELPEPVAAQVQRDELRAVDFEQVRPADEAPPVPAVREPLEAVRTIGFPERVPLKMSGWQSIGAIIVVLGVAVGASGVGAYGLVVAHDWGCRIGLVKTYCPPPPAPPVRQPPRPDIPA
jgi:hypothetical protein